MELKTNPLQSGLAAIGSVLIAGSCCLPLGTFWIAAGVAGASTLLDTLRPYLLGLSIALIAFGFWQVRRAKQCNRKPGIVQSVLLWSAAIFVAASLLFPQALAGWIAGSAPATPSTQSPLANLDLPRFQQQFNSAKGVRMLVMLSPT